MNAMPRILVVDDVAGNRLAVRTILKGIDAELREADNGFDAVSMCLAEDYALILLDVQMPEMDGFEVCEQVRANPQTGEVPIIFLTAAFRADEDKIHGYLSGATDYISKPINDRILRSKVEVYLKLYRQQQALLAANEALRQEVESRKRAEEQLARQARTDALTGILNRRAFFELGNQELSRLRRYGGSACLAMIDIDYFKRVNDTYGHQVGDQALRLLTSTLAGRLRANDIFARVGGEEFAILLTQTALPEATEKLNELLDLMCSTDFVHDEHHDTICFSAGISPLVADDKSVDDAFSRADRLLYKAKSDGRGCVRA
ncbi:diguanylate cyclase [Rhodocyclaceae bacterium]